jgi:Gram-negative bacterial TonB protein C-terminal
MSTGAKYRGRAISFSLGFHAAVLTFVLLAGADFVRHHLQVTQPLRVARIEIAGASHPVPLPFPKSLTAAHTRHPAPYSDAAAKTVLPLDQPQRKNSGGGSPRVPHAGDGSGAAQARNGSDAEDEHPAFPVFSPRPPVTDRSLLPPSERKIVVDVDVDVVGAVVRESLVQGLGNRLDQIVLDTVKSWRFQPATINGKPVPTQAELIFPFNPSYPISDS